MSYMIVPVELSITEEELEQGRLTRLKIEANDRYTNEEGLRNLFCNVIGYREVLHLTYVYHDSIDRYLIEHPSVMFDQEAFRWAKVASEALFNLYQRLGELESNCEDEG